MRWLVPIIWTSVAFSPLGTSGALGREHFGVSSAKAGRDGVATPTPAKMLQRETARRNRSATERRIAAVYHPLACLRELSFEAGKHTAGAESPCKVALV